MAVTSGQPKPQRRFSRGRLSGQVVTEIERMILEEYREPGSYLPVEAELADRFRVSRIVIREAMKILEDRGLVRVRAGRGTQTTAPTAERVKLSLLRLFRDQPLPTLEDMQAMLELREVLEEVAAGLAAVRATPEDLEQIAAALEDMGGEGTVETIVDADLRFHLAIAKAAHNRFFEMVIEPFTQVFIQQIKLTDSFSVGLELHRDIYVQIKRGDAVAARQAVRRLMRSTSAHIKTALGVMASGSRRATNS
jgi:GntR family transcriptional regulator, galactonate operon transcriptional repressor